jgi:hypothetical protein
VSNHCGGVGICAAACPKPSKVRDIPAYVLPHVTSLAFLQPRGGLVSGSFQALMNCWVSSLPNLPSLHHASQTAAQMWPITTEVVSSRFRHETFNQEFIYTVHSWCLPSGPRTVVFKENFERIFWKHSVKSELGVTAISLRTTSIPSLLARCRKDSFRSSRSTDGS